MSVRPEKNKPINIRVHRIVAEVFIGPCPDGYVVNHIDGNKHNNYVENLEYVTPSENNIHALKNGLRHVADMNKVVKIGEYHYRSQITEKQAIEILKFAYKTGYGCRKLSKWFNISRGITNGMISGKTWKHIDREAIKQEITQEIEGEKKYA